ncbi:RNA-binding domain-containing protein [Mycena venus]|uniref:RNA-binding domain-containing protein n=1 Tax=Mycena venus TaxID=2733690 RepID=A0A8H6WYJ8_9AGAR|nr:RNA-binding domain-containing protein [Mycena venus]
MSDLDADLYGDLYGNDDPDFAEPATDNVEATSQPEPAAKPAAKAEPAPAAVPPAATDSTQQKSPPGPASGAQSIPSYMPVTQQIPTYEQPQPYESRSGASGEYQNISVSERSVRPSEMKDEGKMFIGGLNWDTTDDSLRTYFTQFGKVDACTIMRDAAGRSRCFAFLTFEDPASVNAVMVREHFLDGKIIDPKRAIPRQEHQRATKLFIGGLAGSVTSESMREFFSQFGKVIDSTVMLDRETGRSKGFGFVSFEDTNVQPFLGFGNLEIDGKLVSAFVCLTNSSILTTQRRLTSSSRSRATSATATRTRTASKAAGGGGNFAGGAGNFGGQGGGNFGAGGGGNTPFDPQALAQLYTRMFQMTGGGQMNPAMMGMGNMGPMGMGMGRGMGMGMGMGAGMGMGMGAGMGRGMAQGGGGGAGMNPNIPRGPRNGPNGPAGPPGGAMGSGAGVGPQRAGQRGQHNYHPYAR